MIDKSSLTVICKKYNLPTKECKAILIKEGILTEDGQVTARGFKCNIELRNGQYGTYAVYPEESVAAFLRKKLDEGWHIDEDTDHPSTEGAVAGAGKPINKKERTHALITERQVELLFNGGESVSAIAALSGLAKTTIEKKICSCIRMGTIPVEKAVSKEKGRGIISAITSLPEWDGKLKPLKEALGDAYSYFEIQAVLSDEKTRGWLSRQGYSLPEPKERPQ